MHLIFVSTDYIYKRYSKKVFIVRRFIIFENNFDITVKCYNFTSIHFAAHKTVFSFTLKFLKN